ncbi:hypothetical protein SARC_07877 [Sphaeroforma arctica JP610]|uniref:Uncharacterized protein n=1 Tax=Sphaeroforma arctica JP610 TaxID=667725 RepID=A0A0L0FUX1_9EUKA|nr:hypothetical protein SARC_07877 [Sphaeroforma arctica JP610]KNC79738.1 hypothetical protein SARC_07877 [Sphaeroforma arctica JP610]|eukprot:XP_014153640.1 hypothetical protein SARC_07877 [Sphaeroforma arctica JP610]
MVLVKTIIQYFHQYGGSKKKNRIENVQKRNAKAMHVAPKQLHLPDVSQPSTEWVPNSSGSMDFSIDFQSNDSVLSYARPNDFREGPQIRKLKMLQELYVTHDIPHSKSAGHSPVARSNTGSYRKHITQIQPRTPNHSSASVNSASRSPLGRTQSGQCLRNDANVSPLVRTQSGRCLRNRANVSPHTLSRTRRLSAAESTSNAPVARETSVVHTLSEATPRHSASLFSAMKSEVTSEESINLPQKKHAKDTNWLAHLFPVNSPRIPTDGTHSSNYRVSNSARRRMPESSTSLVTQQLVLSTLPSSAHTRDLGSDASLPSAPLQTLIYMNGASPATPPLIVKGRKPKKAMKPIVEKKRSSFRERLGGQHRVQFEETPIEYESFHSSVYDRKPQVTCRKKDSMMLIYRELMTYKLTEMLVHPDSLENTNKHLAKLKPADRAGMVGEVERILINFSC